MPRVKDRLLRTLADMENLRKRTEREVTDARLHGIASFARDVVGVADNMRRALDAVTPELRRPPSPVNALIDGVELTERELLKALEKNGVRQFDAAGREIRPQPSSGYFRSARRLGSGRQRRAGGAARLHDRRPRLAAGSGRGVERRPEGRAGSRCQQRQRHGSAQDVTALISSVKQRCGQLGSQIYSRPPITSIRRCRAWCACATTRRPRYRRAKCRPFAGIRRRRSAATAPP